MVIIEPKNKPTFVLNTNLLENADAYYVMNEVEFIKYNSFILKFDKKKLVQFFSVN
jgi:hypothetical protein